METDCQLRDALCVVQLSQGFGVGSLLMHHVFDKACVVANEAGGHAIILDVMSDSGEENFEKHKAWYQGFGFQSFASNEVRMFMTMKQVRMIAEQSGSYS